ncbi:MAG TPA: AtpZ/AtpI family protein [Thermomicrobiales bacterium]|nr:AtpZ/AtpI family protein [Thermomicrobiales bacterium]
MQIQPSPEQRAGLGAAGVATGIGCSIVVTVIIFIGGGVLIDKAADTAPVFTLVGVVLALTLAGYQLYELSRVGRSDVSPGPLTRQIGRVGRRGPTADPAADRKDEE